MFKTAALKQQPRVRNIFSINHFVGKLIWLRDVQNTSENSNDRWRNLIQDKLFFMDVETSAKGTIRTPTSWVRFCHLNGGINHSATSALSLSP